MTLQASSVRVLDQHERDSLRRPRPLARDDQRADPHIRAMRQLRERADVDGALAVQTSRSRPSRCAPGVSPVLA